MPKKTRKRYTTQEKVAILRLHRFEHVPVSDLCDRHGIHPPMFCPWQEKFVVNGPATLKPCSRRASDSKDRRITLLNQKLQRRHEFLSELMANNRQLTKYVGQL